LTTTILFYRNGLLFSKFNKDHYRNAPRFFKEINIELHSTIKAPENSQGHTGTE
jgi:hypothetical protein